MSKGKHYVVIDTSGRAENIKPEWAWLDILDNVSRIVGSAGGHAPLPDKLLLNGVTIVSKGLDQIGWDYGQRRQKLNAENQAKLVEEFPEPTGDAP
ncbi:hypothetical protein ACELLULO517_07490 [Acidisoma cellulosilytica]|uniref:Uncharacterized protein n=1 Tax=Acidisoma cellulosilyticum TaxID=2802395 RepID=A0A963Z1G1_9PROT|nr:hypothetical protein [Acidisoma cellulosilyticum]MCB8880073.1 hypothetical protein [Acidisoma cellulosilyticum]